MKVFWQHVLEVGLIEIHGYYEQGRGILCFKATGDDVLFHKCKFSISLG